MVLIKLQYLIRALEDRPRHKDFANLQKLEGEGLSLQSIIGCLWLHVNHQQLGVLCSLEEIKVSHIGLKVVNLVWNKDINFCNTCAKQENKIVLKQTKMK